MMYYLDANVILDMIDGYPQVILKFKEIYQKHLIKMSDIVYYEILRGFKYKHNYKNFAVFDDFCKHIEIDYQTQRSLEIAADNYAFLKQNGKLIEDDDILIGSLAIANAAILVTSNTEHLSRLKNIQIENWRK